jgi:hypothetical protein
MFAKVLFLLVSASLLCQSRILKSILFFLSLASSSRCVLSAIDGNAEAERAAAHTPEWKKKKLSEFLFFSVIHGEAKRNPEEKNEY